SFGIYPGADPAERRIQDISLCLRESLSQRSDPGPHAPRQPPPRGHRPAAWNRLSFIWSRPSRERSDQDLEWAIFKRSELKAHSGWDRKAGPGLYVDFFFVSTLASPHLAPTVEHVPDFLHRSMPHGTGNRS